MPKSALRNCTLSDCVHGPRHPLRSATRPRYASRHRRAVGDPRAEPGLRAHLDQVQPAPVAAGDPRVVPVVGQRRAAAGGEEVERVVEQVQQPDVGRLRGGVVIPEDDRDIEVRRPSGWDVIGGLLGEFDERIRRETGLDWAE